MATFNVAFTRPVSDVMVAPPPVLSVNDSCLRLIKTMTENNETSVLVRDEHARIVGIVTQQDVTRRLALRLNPETRIKQVMTLPVDTVRPDSMLYIAIGKMRHRHTRHLPVITTRHEVVGVLHLRHALASATSLVVDQIDRLVHEETIQGLREVKSVQAEIAADLLEDRVEAAVVQSLLSHVNRDIHRRVADRVLAEMQDDGFGEPPAAFAVIVMGSGGRDENFLFPDQDNGLILADYPDSEHGAMDRYFIEFSERLTRILDEIGFPLCRGNVMATNPVWRKTISQWKNQTIGWARNRGPIAVRFADIFFDFKPVWGDFALAADLRDHVTGLMKNNVPFLAEVAKDQRIHGTALRSFRRFRIEPGTRNEVNLKRRGLQTLVNSIRILSLREGVKATPTLERIARLGERGVIDFNDAEEMQFAYRFIARILLKQQLASFQNKLPVTNTVPLDTLAKVQKKHLKQAFILIEEMRGRAFGELTGDVLQS